MKITVLGSGGWGTALALLLLENGNDVTLWSYSAQEVAVIEQTGENPQGRAHSRGAEADLRYAGGPRL